MAVNYIFTLPEKKYRYNSYNVYNNFLRPKISVRFSYFLKLNVISKFQLQFCIPSTDLRQN